MERADLLSMTLPRLEGWVVQELGQPKFRAGQLYQWMHQKEATSFDEMTNLSVPLRETL